MPPPLETNSGGLAKDMTLRDWYAGQVICSIADSSSEPEVLAEHAYRIASALLIERERGE